MKRILLLSFLISPTAASAGFVFSFIDGNTLHQWCQDERYEEIRIAYVVGSWDSYAAYTDALYPDWSCLPESVLQGQVTDVVCDYLEENPERRHRTAASSIQVAVRQAFSCPLPE